MQQDLSAANPHIYTEQQSRWHGAVQLNHRQKGFQLEESGSITTNDTGYH